MQILKRIILLALVVSAFAIGAAAQVSVTATAGTNGPTAYTTLTDAFTAINAGTHQGAITVSITANTTEPANTSAVLNSSGAGAASYTSVLVRPTVDGVIITGSGGTGTACGGKGLIELNGADNVTIDGDNPNSAGTNRNLTLTDTCIGTYASVIRIALATTIVTSADNNTFRNLVINGSAPGRNITTATSTTGTENTTYGILAAAGASTAAATTAPATITSTASLIATGATATNLTIDNNTITTTARAIAVQGSATTVFPGLAITNNIIGNPTAGAVDQVYSFGITAQGSTNAVISSNTVYVESFLGTSLRGIDTGSISATGTGFTFARNKVNRVLTSSTTGFGAYGINISSGNNHIVRNNFVSGSNNVAAGNFSTTFGAFGIRIASGTGHQIYHNSINIYGTQSGTGQGFSAGLVFVATTTTGMDVRNNIFADTQSGGSATSVFVSVYFPTGLTNAFNLTLNNNDYFQGTNPTNNGIAQVGTAAVSLYQAANFNPNDTTTATNLRTFTSTLSAAGTNDNASKVVDPLFISNTDLHIAANSPMVDMGVNVGVLQDIDGQNRVPPPDIGADEPSGLTPPANDIAATAIIAPANGSTFGFGATPTPQATFTNVGTAAQTNVMVQFMITGPGGYSYSDTQTIATINPNQTVTVTFALAPAFTTAGTYTTTVRVLTSDANTGNDMISGSFTVVAPVTGGSVTVGTGGNFTSLTNPGGIFDTLNAAGATGSVTINITSDLTGETGSIALNQLPAGINVTISPSGAARTITSTATAISVIKLNDADNVTIDGSLNGGTDRSLTIINSNNTTANTTVIWIASANNGAQNNTVRSTELAGGVSQSVTNAFNFGIISSSSAALLTGGTNNNNNTYTNNFIRKVGIGIISIGGLATNLNQNTTISNNQIGPAAFGMDEISLAGILIFNENLTNITNNEIRFIGDAATTGGSSGRDHVGITLGTTGATWSTAGGGTSVTVTNANVSRNRVHDVVERATFSAVGIVENSLGTAVATNNTIANNVIYNIQANGTSGDDTVGIGISGGNGDTIAFNSVNLTGDIDPGTATSAATSSFGISVATVTPTNLSLRDNISVIDLTSNTATLLNSALNLPSTTYAFGTGGSNYNDLYAPAANTQSRVASTGTTTFTFYATLAAYQAAVAGQDVNSISADPLFTSATDLHILTGSPVINAGTAIAGITTDFEGQMRDATPDIGADEFGTAQPGVLALSSSTYTVAENVAGGLATITVNRTGGTDNAASVTYTLTDISATGGATCAAGVDFINTGGTVIFAAGQASQTFTVQICDDAVFEGSESFNVILGTTTGGATIGTPAAAVVAITDNEIAQPGTIALSSATYSVGESAGTVTITVNRTGGTDGAVSVPYTVGGGTATGGATCAPGVDFINTGGTVSFPNGNGSQTLTVTICSDTVNEPTETFTVTLGTATGGATVGTPSSATVTIVDDDAPTGLGGIVSVGTGQTYTSLTNTGGAFDALNTQGATSNVTFNITSDLTGETGAVALNEVAGGFTVLIKPSGAARTISGTSAASSGIIILNGADNVTIDGSLTGSNDRSLTITNATTTSVVVWIRSASATNGAIGNTVKNTNLAGSVATNIIAGVLSGSSTFGSAAASPNSNNTIQNNTVIKAQNALFLSGNATTFDQNWLITDNILGSTTAAEKLSFRGMLVGGMNNFTITKNTIMGVVSTTTSTSTVTGIQLSANATNGVITRNNISDIKQINTGGYGANGINLSQTSTTANDLVANNFIRDVAGVGFAGVAIGDNGYGIVVGSGGGYNIYFNSVNLATSQTAAGSITGAINILAAVTTAGAVNLRDNILVNTETVGTSFAVIDSSSQGAAVFAAINYNDYFAQNVGRSGTTTVVTYPTLAAWQGFTGMDVNSKAVDPVFVSAVNLHIVDNSPLVDMGTPIASVINDFDGEVRSTTTPDIGADETFGIVVQSGVFSLSSATYSVNENGGSVTVTVNRTGGSDGTVSVTIATSNGTAVGGPSCANNPDYMALSTILNFNAGETTKSFAIPICDDTLVEGNETFNVSLSNPFGGATIGTPATAVITIIDNDMASGSFTISDARVTEGNSGLQTAIFNVTLTGGGAATANVQFTTANGTAIAGVDYQANNGIIAFAPGQTMQTISVSVIGDTLKEANETFFVNLSNPTGATIADAQGIGVIVDDDHAVNANFDADRRTDLSVFRPSDGVWYVLPSIGGLSRAVPFGTNGDIPVPGNYDGNIGTTYAVFRPSNATWYISRIGGVPAQDFDAVQFGLSTDIPVQGDYDGDGKTDIAVFRPSNGTWYVRNSSNNLITSVQFGANGDIPVQGDYDGDAKTDIAIYRNGIWYVLNASNGSFTAINFGTATDKPLVGDFDGDGKYDYTVFRTGVWYIFQSQTFTARSVSFGFSSDIPSVGDYDGDGTADIAVFRPSSGTFYILQSSNGGFNAQQYGQNGDIPIPASYQSRQ